LKISKGRLHSDNNKKVRNRQTKTLTKGSSLKTGTFGKQGPDQIAYVKLTGTTASTYQILLII
jgi:hypothetical protein